MTRRILELSLDDASTKPLQTECVETLDQFLAGETSLEKVKEISNQNLDVMHSIDHRKSFCDALTRESHWASNVMINECCSTEFYQRGWIYSPGKQKVDVVQVCKEIQWIKSLVESGPERDSADSEIRKRARGAGRKVSFQELGFRVALAQQFAERFSSLEGACQEE